MAAGTTSDPPRIVADFNGWDPAAGVMTRGAGGLYELHTQLDSRARIEYLIAYRDRFEVDPSNPLHVPSPTGALRSELRMPGYQPLLSLRPPSLPGVTRRIPFAPKNGDVQRVIRVHRPHNATDPLPVLYVHDGDIATRALDLPAMIDSLINAGRMAPITAVFIDSVDRHEDYSVGSMFSYAFASEIVPAVEQRFAPVAGARSILGFSRSTVGALDAALNSGVAFARCGLVAPAMNAQTRAALFRQPRGQSTHVTMAIGTYDLPLIDDARALRKELEARHITFDWLEVPEGHNHTAWKAQLPRLLTSWFPPVKSSGHMARSAVTGSTRVARRAGR